jgi:hypothetical protein
MSSIQYLIQNPSVSYINIFRRQSALETEMSFFEKSRPPIGSKLEEIMFSQRQGLALL